jgi:hypothetical protein
MSRGTARRTRRSPGTARRYLTRLADDIGHCTHARRPDLTEFGRASQRKRLDGQSRSAHMLRSRAPYVRRARELNGRPNLSFCHGSETIQSWRPKASSERPAGRGAPHGEGTWHAVSKHSHVPRMNLDNINPASWARRQCMHSSHTRSIRELSGAQLAETARVQSEALATILM